MPVEIRLVGEGQIADISRNGNFGAKLLEGCSQLGGQFAIPLARSGSNRRVFSPYLSTQLLQVIDQCGHLIFEVIDSGNPTRSAWDRSMLTRSKIREICAGSDLGGYVSGCALALAIKPRSRKQDSELPAACNVQGIFLHAEFDWQSGRIDLRKIPGAFEMWDHDHAKKVIKLPLAWGQPKSQRKLFRPASWEQIFNFVRQARELGLTLAVGCTEIAHKPGRDAEKHQALSDLKPFDDQELQLILDSAGREFTSLAGGVLHLCMNSGH